MRLCKRGDVLLERLLLHRARSRRLDAGDQLDVGAVGRVDRLQIGELVLDASACGRSQRGASRKRTSMVWPLRVMPPWRTFFLAQRDAHVASERLGPLGQGRLHVHLQHEVHAAAQVQARDTWAGACDAVSHAGERDQQIEGHDIGGVGRVGVERALDRILGLELGVGVGKAGFDGVALEHHAVRRNTGGLERRFDPVARGIVQPQGRLGHRHLHRRRLTKQIGQRVQPRNDERDQQNRVLPQRIPVQ